MIYDSNVRTRLLDFESFRGNENIKAVVCQGLAKGTLGHIVINGPTGSGKTSLAELIARSLLCEARLSDGRHCGACSNCTSELSSLFDFKKVDCPKEGDPEKVTCLVRDYGEKSPFFADRRVIIFDEAQALTGEAQDKILGLLENKRSLTTCIFTSIMPDDLIEPLTGRTRRFTLEMPDHGQSLRYLEELSAGDNITADRDALSLIAAYSKGYRVLGANLATAAAFAHGGPVTVQIVREALLRDQSQGTLSFLKAAALGHLDGQYRALEEMSLTPTEQVTWLIDVLRHLIMQFVGPDLCMRARDSLNLLLAREDCQHVVGHFAMLAQQRGQTLAALFDEILEYWLVVPRDVDATRLAGHVLRFHSLLRVCVVQEKQLTGTLPPRSKAAPDKARKTVSWRKRVGVGLIDPQGPHLLLHQAAELYEPATYLVQAYGKTFNHWCTVDFPASGRSDDENSDVVSQMLKQLRARLFERPAAELGPGADLHRITYNERLAGGGFRSKILMHVPADVLPGVGIFFDRWVNRQEGSIAFHHDGEFHDRLPAAISYQWTLMRRLWAGLSPDEILGGVPAFERLRIKPTEARVVGPIDCRRYSVSGSIGEGTRNKAMADCLGHLSAWRDGAWSSLFRGWEGPEYSARHLDEQTRARRIEDIERSYTVANALEQSSLAAALANERATWPVHPYHRQRAWKGQWWLGGKEE